MTKKTIKKLIHLTAHLQNGIKILVVCKDIPDLEDQTTSTIEKVSCLNCLKTYHHYLELMNQGKSDKISDTKH